MSNCRWQAIKFKVDSNWHTETCESNWHTETCPMRSKLNAQRATLLLAHRTGSTQIRDDSFS